MFKFCNVSEVLRESNENEKKESVLVCEGKINFEILIRCSRDVKADNEKMNVKYSLTVENDDYRPFGINVTLFNNDGKIIAEEHVKNKFSTISEVVCAIRMLAKETVLPFNAQDVLV